MKIGSPFLEKNVEQPSKLSNNPFLCEVPEVKSSLEVATIGTKEAQTTAKTMNELSEGYRDLQATMKNMSTQVGATRKLWRSKNKSMLIKVGLALIAFPDPTISDVVGGVLVAAGTVQEGIRRQSLHMEDIPKSFQETLKVFQSTKENL